MVGRRCLLLFLEARLHLVHLLAEGPRLAQEQGLVPGAQLDLSGPLQQSVHVGDLRLTLLQ